MSRLRHILNRAERLVFPGDGGLSVKSPRRRPDEHVAVYVSGSAVAVAHCLRAPDADGELAAINMRTDAIQDLRSLPATLTAQADALRVGRRACNLVLAPELYNLNLVERPEVEDAEVRDAVRWSIQDQVDYPVEDAVLDVFDLPKSASRERPMVFVVSAQSEFLQTLVKQVRGTGLGISSIDIAELALRNLVWRCYPGADQSVAMLRLTANSGLIGISRGEELYLSRRISGVPRVFAEETWPEFRERMLLQVQRSIDYYESAMGQPHCNMLMVACTHDWSQRVCEYLSEVLAIPVREVSPLLHDEIDLGLFNPEREEINWQAPSSAQANAIAAGLPALGGVLRHTIQAASEGT